MAALKCDDVFGRFFESVSAQYKSLIPVLSYHLTISRNRNVEFLCSDYNFIYQSYQNVLNSNGFIKDNIYDWI